MTYRGKLQSKEEVVGDILIVRLAPAQGFGFRAGQWCFLNLPDRGLQDERGLRRHLSLASSPGDPEMVFATKLSGSAFKQTLARLEPGAEITLEEPRGSLALPEDPAEPLAFLAGGIGITPFRAMLRHAAQAATGHKITLFYSNRTPEETVFLEDLEALGRAHANLQIVATMTRMHQSSRPWDGPTGRLTGELIRERLPQWKTARYFLAGPPPMVDAMAGTLEELGVPGDRVRAEKFSGY
jgi:ferredoxin-NADP reductase